MSDPQPDRLKKRPERAEPIQPDKPSEGTLKKSTDAELRASDERASRERSERALKQAEAARKNVSEGYD